MTRRLTLGRCVSADDGFDVVESPDALERLPRQWRGLVDVHVMELATHMRPAGDLDDPVAVEPVIAGVAVRLQEAPERPKMILGPLALAIGRVAEQHRSGRTVAGGAVVAHVYPQPTSAGLAMARRQHRHGRVVGMQLARLQRLLRQRLDQRLQQGACAADPVRQGRALQLNAFTGVDRALPVQRQMIGILGHQDVGEQARACHTARDRPRRRFALHDPLAAGARQLGPNVPDHPEARGHILQHLRAVLAQAAQGTATSRAAAGGLVDDLLARQVVRQRPTCWPANNSILRSCCGARRRALLGVLQLQLQLGDLAFDLLRRSAELLPPQPRQLRLQSLDDPVAFIQRRTLLEHQSAQLLGGLGQGIGFEHAA